MDSEIFNHQRTVRFGECDPAGVVYYPVFFNWFHEAMEAWFEDGLDIAYAQVLQEYGFPAAETSAQFQRPITLGEKITVQLLVSKMGRTSFSLQFTIVNAKQDIKAKGHVRCVCISVAGGLFQFSSAEIPTFLRQEISRFLLT
jgi:4-hydroxybenzoyl-CoA thioesterase